MRQRPDDAEHPEHASLRFHGRLVQLHAKYSSFDFSLALRLGLALQSQFFILAIGYC